MPKLASPRARDCAIPSQSGLPSDVVSGFHAASSRHGLALSASPGGNLLDGIFSVPPSVAFGMLLMCKYLSRRQADPLPFFVEWL